MGAVAEGGEARAVPQGDGALAVSGTLTFDSVPDLYNQSADWAQKANGTLTIDLKDVDRVDSAGVALLVEWLREARAKGVALKFVNVPEQTRSLVRVSGLSEALGLNNHD